MCKREPQKCKWGIPCISIFKINFDDSLEAFHDLGYQKSKHITPVINIKSISLTSHKTKEEQLPWSWYEADTNTNALSICTFWKNQVQQTGLLICNEIDFLQASQAVKIQFEMD